MMPRRVSGKENWAAGPAAHHMARSAKAARGRHSTLLRASSGSGARLHEPSAGAQTTKSHGMSMSSQVSIQRWQADGKGGQQAGVLTGLQT